MHPNRSGHSRQYSDRGSRQWDGYDERRERRESHRDVQWDHHHKYGGEGHGGTERMSGSREYSDSPKRLYSKDSERSRKSPLRRRMSSPDWGASDKRRRFTDGEEDDYRYRRVSLEDKASRLSADSFAHEHITADFKSTPLQEEDFKYRKTTQDSRHRYRNEESSYRQPHNELPSRRSSGYHKDRDDRSWDCSPERTRSQEHSAKYLERHVTHQAAAVPEPKKSTNGFQRFLDVLNKGVNVATLTKIVTQTSTKVEDLPHSPTSFRNTADQPWSPTGAGRHRESPENMNHWSESQGFQRMASPQPRHRSFSPQGGSLPHERPLQRVDGEQSYFGSNAGAASPSVVEKKTVTPDDESKHKHMQDVLQVIGIDLGFEELGQMSNRIQERLYGKKDNEEGHQSRGSGERDTRRAVSPRPQNRSSSSRSSFSPSTREYCMTKDSYSAQRDVTDNQPSDFGSSSVLQESDEYKTNSQESAATGQTFSQNPIYTSSEPCPTPAMPMYSPASCSPLPYPGLFPNYVGPGAFLPHIFPYPHAPPLNIFPTMLTQTGHLFPQHFSNPQLPFNLPVQPPNATQKSKTPSRPRCLQVIETKQPG